MLRRLITALLIATATACASTSEIGPLAQDSPAASASPADPSPIGTIESASKGDPERQTESGAPKPEPDRGTVWCAEEEAVNDHGDFVCVEWFIVDDVADVDRLDRGHIATITINWSDCVGDEGGQVHSWCPGLTSGRVEAWTAEDVRALARAFDRFSENERADGNDDVAGWQARTADAYRRYADDIEAGRRAAPTEGNEQTE